MQAPTLRRAPQAAAALADLALQLPASVLAPLIGAAAPAAACVHTTCAACAVKICCLCPYFQKPWVSGGVPVCPAQGLSALACTACQPRCSVARRLPRMLAGQCALGLPDARSWPGTASRRGGRPGTCTAERLPELAQATGQQRWQRHAQLCPRASGLCLPEHELGP